MSRAQTTLNALLAAMFLVSLLPATQAASDPATTAQEDAIDAVDGMTVPPTVAWQVRNELQELFLKGASPGTLSYTAPHPDDAESSHTLAGTPAIGTPPVDDADIPGMQVTPGATPAVFHLGQTIAETEISSFAASLWVTTTQATSIKVDLVYAIGTADEVVVKSIAIPINGVVVALPGPVGEPSEYGASGLVTPPVLVPVGEVLSVRVSSDSANPVNLVTLSYGTDEHPSRVSLTADSARVKAWTEKLTTPGFAQSNFASPINAVAEDRTLKFHFAEVHAMNETAVQAYPLGFKVIGPEGKVHFDSSGSPVGVTAAPDQRWGAAATLPADNVGLPGVVQKSYSLTYPQSLGPGAYVIQIKPVCPARVTCPTWTVDVPVNVGASDGVFSNAPAGPRR